MTNDPQSDTVSKIGNQIQNNKALLYMKGTPDFPMCGFSGRVVQILSALNAQYAYVNVLDELDVRATLPRISDWPTFPQFYLEGELIGGCDILSELYQTGELESLLESAGLIENESSVARPVPA